MVLLGTHYERIQLLYKNSDETEVIMLERPNISIPVDNHSEPGLQVIQPKHHISWSKDKPSSCVLSKFLPYRIFLS